MHSLLQRKRQRASDGRGDTCRVIVRFHRRVVARLYPCEHERWMQRAFPPCAASNNDNASHRDSGEHTTGRWRYACNHIELCAIVWPEISGRSFVRLQWHCEQRITVALFQPRPLNAESDVCINTYLIADMPSCLSFICRSLYFHYLPPCYCCFDHVGCC